MKNICSFLVLFTLGILSCGTTPDKKAFFTGDGGKGMSLTILAPKTTGLLENQLYLPTLIQGEFVSNFLNYSAISVLDRVRLEEQYAELLSGYYDDNSEAGSDLGHLLPTDYIMLGNITKTSTGYALQISITRSADKMTVASYSGNCTFAELDNLVGVRRVSLDLLEKLNITTTERTRTELGGGVSANYVSAQTSLARGITAQRNGNIGQSLSYFYNAISFEPTLAEAKSRVSNISSNVSTGNIGENARNAIAYRNAWKKILDECDTFLMDYLPFEINYNSKINQKGGINYRRESVDLNMEINVKPTELFKMIQDIQKGLNKTGKKDEWGFEIWPFSTGFEEVGEKIDELESVISLFGGNTQAQVSGSPFGKNLNVTIALINDNGETISVKSTDIFGQAGTFVRKTWYDRGFGKNTTTVSIKPIPKKFSILFENVDVNKITDNTTIKIITINGRDTEVAGIEGYIKIVNN
jgi:hypothetical protein